MTKKKQVGWKKRLKQAFKKVGLVVVNPNRCGGEPTIGETRFRLSELFEYIEGIEQDAEKKMGKALRKILLDDCFCDDCALDINDFLDNYLKGAEK